MIVVQAAIAGALTGGLFALMAIGPSLTWGMLRVINVAHFALILLGAYVTFQLSTANGIDPLATLAVTVPLLFVLGAALQWGFERFELSEFNSLLVSFGVLIVVIQAVANYWSADFQRIPDTANRYATGAVHVGALAFPMPTLLAFVFGLGVVVVGRVALDRTYAGRALRAFAQDRSIAAAYGVDSRRLGVVLAGLSGATAALAGAVYAIGNSLAPSAPFDWFGIVFAVIILGGIGDIAGTLVAGVLVGLVSGVIAVVWSPAASPLVVFSLIVLALLFRPRGLLVRAHA